MLYLCNRIIVVWWKGSWTTNSYFFIWNVLHSKFEHLLNFVYIISTLLVFLYWSFKATELYWLLFQVATRAGWLPAEDNRYPQASHERFGLVSGEDGKWFRITNTNHIFTFYFSLPVRHNRQSKPITS